MNVNISSAPAATPPVALVRDSTDRAFKADVIDASLEAPVLVDFWAPWCGPCRSLSPNIEKVVKEKAGKIRLVKINIDENPQIAGQLGVQSIPAVFAFAGGRPVDAFLGNIPESEVRKFADKVIAAAPAGRPAQGSVEDEIKNALTAAKEGLAAGDLNTAAQIYGMVLQHQPENAEALLGMARVYLKAGEAEQAQAVFGTIPEAARKGADYASLAAELKLLTEAAAVGGTADLARKVEKAPDDHQARYDLAIALNAEGKRVEAAEQLVTLMKRDRTWNDDGARKKLLEFFEAWGAKDAATLKGRRLLSSLLFS
ncbi:MAG TPA: co-chaperone YbbN [Caulobacteraceae bacterium]|nr:co-chaperone YbbN [Caulobacteraceae bacterium]